MNFMERLRGLAALSEFGYKTGVFTGRLGGKWAPGTRWSLITPDSGARYPRTVTIRHKDNPEVSQILNRKSKDRVSWDIVDSPEDDHRTYRNGARVGGIMKPMLANLSKNRKEIVYRPETLSPETSGITTNEKLGSHYERMARRAGYQADHVSGAPNVILKKKEFSLLAGAGIAGGLHVGMNVLYKRMLKPNTLMNRVGAAIYQTGVRHAKSGKMIHPAITKTADIVAGPELAEIYHQGLGSRRFLRKGGTIIASKIPGANQATKAAAGIVAGPRSKITEKIISKLPQVPMNRAPKKSDYMGAGIVGGAMAAVEPIYPAYNVVRTAVAHSKYGTKILKDRFAKGAASGAKTGIGRHIEDYLATPSLNAAQDIGDNPRVLRPFLLRP